MWLAWLALLAVLALLSIALVWALSQHDIIDDRGRRWTRAERRRHAKNKADLRVALGRKN